MTRPPPRLAFHNRRPLQPGESTAILALALARSLPTPILDHLIDTLIEETDRRAQTGAGSSPSAGSAP